MSRERRPSGASDGQRGALPVADAGDGLADVRARAIMRRAVQRKAEREARAAAVPEGGGKPLDAEVRARMEPRLGADLGKVRVHDDGASGAAAEAMGARAFTVGNHIHFGAGQLASGTRDGDRLLAHELTHVVQGTGRAPIARKESGDDAAAEGAAQTDVPTATEGGGAAAATGATSEEAAAEGTDAPTGEPVGEVPPSSLADEAEQVVSQPADPAEREADAVADKVTDDLHGDSTDGATGGETETAATPREEAAPIAAKLGGGPQAASSRTDAFDEEMAAIDRAIAPVLASPIKADPKALARIRRRSFELMSRRESAGAPRARATHARVLMACDAVDAALSAIVMQSLGGSIGSITSQAQLPALDRITQRIAMIGAIADEAGYLSQTRVAVNAITAQVAQQRAIIAMSQRTAQPKGTGNLAGSGPPPPAPPPPPQKTQAQPQGQLAGRLPPPPAPPAPQAKASPTANPPGGQQQQQQQQPQQQPDPLAARAQAWCDTHSEELMRLQPDSPASVLAILRMEEEVQPFSSLESGEIRIVRQLIADKKRLLVEARNAQCEAALKSILSAPTDTPDAMVQISRPANSVEEWLATSLPDPKQLIGQAVAAKMAEVRANDEKAAQGKGAAGGGPAGQQQQGEPDRGGPPQNAQQTQAVADEEQAAEGPQAKEQKRGLFGSLWDKLTGKSAKREAKQKAIQLGQADGEAALQCIADNITTGVKLSLGNFTACKTTAEFAAAWDRHYGENPAQSWANFVLPKYGPNNIRGFYIDGHSYVNVEATKQTGGGLKTSIRELLHANSHPAWKDMIGTSLNEGITEYLTQSICAKEGIAGPASYASETSVVRALLARGCPEELLRAGYFQGEWHLVAGWVTQSCGGSWLELVNAMKHGDADRAKMILKGARA